MNISFIGLGKLGLPVALAIESKGHAVRAYDVRLSAYEPLMTINLQSTENYD